MVSRISGQGAMHLTALVLAAKLRLHGIPGLPVDDGRVLAIILLALVGDFAGIDGIGKHLVEMPSTEWPIPPRLVAG